MLFFPERNVHAPRSTFPFLFPPLSSRFYLNFKLDLLILLQFFNLMATKALTRAPGGMTLRRAASLSSLITARRTLTTSLRSNKIHPSRAQIKPTLSSSHLQQLFRRSYADISQPKARRKGGGFFRWTWRLVYLSAIGGVAYLSYSIYDLRTPPEQLEVDSSKKTLVILGKLVPHARRKATDHVEAPDGVPYRS